MTTPYPLIYADFNGLDYSAAAPADAVMYLTGYGTLASLARHRVRLKEGMTIRFYEPEDIECLATVHFDKDTTDPADRQGAWIARLDASLIIDSSELAEASDTHPCLACGHDFKGNTRYGSYREECAACGASVMAPMAPPEA